MDAGKAWESPGAGERIEGETMTDRGREEPGGHAGIPSQPVRNAHLLAPLFDPQSTAAEQYRAIKARLDYLGRIAGKPLQTIVVTSASPGDGKTLTALNLALVLAHDTARDVLLIESDLRRPALRDYFTHRPEYGLVEVLANEVRLSAALLRPEGSRLLILPAGGHTDYPAELLSSTKMQRLMEILRRRFHSIILDTPPVVPFVDADQMASQADGVLLVVRASQTQRKAVTRAIELLSKHPIAGIVFNDIRPTAIDRYYYYYGYDYEYRHRDREKARPKRR